MRRLAACSIVVVALLAGAAARQASAQGSEKERARKLMQEAAALLDKHDPKGALAKVEEAHKLYPSPKTFFNLGVLYQELGMNVNAHEAYGRFVQEARDASPAQKKSADEALQSLRKLIAFLEVRTNVDGVAVTVDGRAQGRTRQGAALSLRLNPGSYEVAGEKDGYLARRESVLLGAGESRQIDLVLAAAPAPASATALPPGPPPVAREPAAGTTTAIKTSAPTPARSMNKTGPVLTLIGALAISGGIVAAVMANGEFDTAKKAGCPHSAMPSMCSTSADKVQQLNTVSYVLYGAGGLLAAIGVGVWIAAPYNAAAAPAHGFTGGLRGTF